MNNLVEGALLFLLCLCILAAVFLICRSLTLWYFRLNEIADTFRKIEIHLRPPGYVESKPPKPEVPRWNP